MAGVVELETKETSSCEVLVDQRFPSNKTLKDSRLICCWMVFVSEATGGFFNSIKSFKKGPMEVGALEWGKADSCFNFGESIMLEERAATFELLTKWLGKGFSK